METWSTEMRIGILNVTGYAGLELIRLLAWHPEMQIVAVTGRSQAGKRLAEVFPIHRSLSRW